PSTPASGQAARSPPISQRPSVGGVAVQPDGKIVAAGAVQFSASSDFALARYNTDGTLDGTFGAGGKVTTDFTGGYDFATSVVVQPDGKILAGGNAGMAPFAGFALARYNSDGSLDATFGTGGKVATGFFDTVFGQVSATAYSLALQPD